MIEKHVIPLSGRKLNYDDNIDIMPMQDGDAMDLVYETGNYNVIENRDELTTITISGIGGTNKKQIGACIDTENNAIIFAVYTSIDDYIFRVFSDNSYELLSQGDWGFDPDYPMRGMFIIGTEDDATLMFNDNLNPPRAVNIAKLLNGDYPLLAYNEVNLHKPASTSNLSLFYDTNVLGTTTEESNSSKVRQKRFQFAISNVYDNGLQSSVGHWSGSIVDYRDEFPNGELDRRHKTNFSRIRLDIPVEYDNISYVKIYVKNVDIGSGSSGSWYLYDTWEVDYDFVSSGIYQYYFYNDKQRIPVDQTLFNSLYDAIPFKSRLMTAINGDRILLAGNNDNYDNVDIDITLSNITDGDATYFSSIIVEFRQITDNLSVSYGECNVKAVTNLGWIQFTLLLGKVDSSGPSPVLTSSETYTYQYYNSNTSGGFMANSDVVDYFVAQINAETSYSDITATSVTGGNPNMIRITKSSGAATFDYTFTIVSTPVIPKYSHIKSNDKINLAIAYYDKYDKSGRCMIKGLSHNTANENEFLSYNYIKYEIEHLPPSWAVCYQFLYSGGIISSFFSVPVLMHDTYATLDFEHTEGYTKIDIDQALERCYEYNPGATLNNYEIQAGDRVRITNYQQIVMSYSTGGVAIAPPIDYIDVEVVGIDDDGKIILPTLTSYSESDQWGLGFKGSGARYFYLFEFYRTQDLSQENNYYYECGDVIPITGGYHKTTRPSNSTETIRNQSDGVSGIGVLNFGNAYSFTWHFCNVLLEDNYTPTELNVVIVPIIFQVDSMSSSFGYDSKNYPTGRFNWYDEKWEQKTEETLVYGNLYRTGSTSYNEINRFVNDPRYMSSKYGKIRGIEQRGYTLLVMQEKKLTPIYLNRQETQLADGSTQLVYSDAVLGSENALPLEVGCSHEGSVDTNIYNTYFWDSRSASWYRFGQDGLNNITYNDKIPEASAKMKNYGITLSKMITAAEKRGDSIEIYSGYDPVKDMYMFTYKNNTTSSENVTLGYHEPTNSWLSFYSFYHTLYLGFNENRFFSFSGGVMYEHHIHATKVSTGTMQIHFNLMPADRKMFRSIIVNAEKVWAPTEIGDILVDQDYTKQQNPDTYEWYLAKMSSLLKESHFEYYEGGYRAIFKGNILDKDGNSVGLIGLENGERLKGKVATITLRNTKTTDNTIVSVTIGYQNSI